VHAITVKNMQSFGTVLNAKAGVSDLSGELIDFIQ